MQRMSKAWKVEEARVAALFGCRRRPLSGNSRAGLGAGDMMTQSGGQPDIVVEVKSWARMPLAKHADKVRREAAGAPWVLAIHVKGSPNRFAVVDLELLAELWIHSKKNVENLFLG